MEDKSEAMPASCSFQDNSAFVAVISDWRGISTAGAFKQCDETAAFVAIDSSYCILSSAIVAADGKKWPSTVGALR